MVTAHEIAAYAVIATGALVAIVLTFLTAPYGRHARSGWGPGIPTRTAWMLMESPPVLVFAWFFSTGSAPSAHASIALAALWLTHYVDRDLLYPLRMRTRPSDRTPIVIVAMGVTFNTVNGWLNGAAAAGPHATTWLSDPRFVLGALVFVTGFVINRRADATLRRLRDDTTDYAIPHGHLYRWISCPNYLGELVQWVGWALASWSLAGLAFALFSAANLVPRAVSHHRWYRETFPDYPPKRRAILPGIL